MTPEFRTGDVPPGFDLLRPIASSKTTELWKFCARQNGQPYACKRLRAEVATDERFLQKMKTEAHAAAIAGGTHVRKLHHDWTDHKSRTLILEWLDGETLAERLERDGVLAAAHAMWIARQVAQGLQELQSAGIEHGALCPSHIFLETNGRVRLLSPGAISWEEDDIRTCHACLNGELAAHLAPERQSRMTIAGFPADAYSLGIVLYRMFAGRLPFSGESTADILRLHRQALPPPMERQVGSLLPALGDLIAGLLSKQPMRRPHTGSELLRSLIAVEVDSLAWRRVG